MTVNLFDVESRELVLVFYDSECVVNIWYGAEKWEHGRVLELLRQVSDVVPYDRLDLSGLTSAIAEGMSVSDMCLEMDRLYHSWGCAAEAAPGCMSIDLTSAGQLSRYALGYDC